MIVNLIWGYQVVRHRGQKTTASQAGVPTACV